MGVIEAEEEAPPPPSDEAVSGLSKSLPQDDIRAHQDLLKRIAANLGLELEELKESSHSLINILASAVPSKVALLINEAVMGLVKALWQTPSLSPTSERAEKKYYVPASGYK